MSTSTSVASLDVRPRVRSVPECVSSAGQECIELAASAGLQLDPWQQAVLHDALGERADGKWAAFEVALIVGRQNGKGSCLEARELAGLFLFGEKLILHSAHEFKTAAEAFRRVLALVENTDDLRKRVKKVQIGHGDEGIELLPKFGGGRLRFVARSTGSGRGFSGDLNLLDEAYALTAAQIEALLPTMSARDNPQVWYTSSPPLDSTTALPLFGVRRRGLAGDKRLCYLDFGADGDLSNLAQVDLDDRTLWAATNPAYGIRIDEEFIELERGAMTPTGFARERLGIWPLDPEDANVGAIDPRKWATLKDSNSRRDGDIAVAADISVLRDYASIAVYGKRSDGIGHAQLIDYRPGVDWVVPRLIEIRKELDPIAFGLGPGTFESLVKELTDAQFYRPDRLPEAVLKKRRNDETPRRGDLLVAVGAEMAAACGQLVDAVRQDAFRVVPAVQLDDSIVGAKIRQSGGDGMAWSRASSEAEISPLGALTLARYAYETRAWLFANKKKRAPVGAPSQSALSTANLFRPQGRLKI